MPGEVAGSQTVAYLREDYVSINETNSNYDNILFCRSQVILDLIL